MAVRITCIRKAGGYHENPYVAIASLQWVNPATNEWGESTREEMYHFVVNQNGEAYVESGLYKAYLVGAVSPGGTKYVKTRADNTEQDNLLALSECR